MQYNQYNTVQSNMIQISTIQQPLISLSFIHSFIQAISIVPLQIHYNSEALPTHTDTALEFHAAVPQATVSEGLAQGN